MMIFKCQLFEKLLFKNINDVVQEIIVRNIDDIVQK